MPNNPNYMDNITPPKKGEIRNPKGKPKGTIHISTHIKNLLEDEEFEAIILDSKKGVIEYKGVPVKAIIAVAIQKALAGDQKWADWLAKYGYGQKIDVRVSDWRTDILERYGLTDKGEHDRQTEETES